MPFEPPHPRSFTAASVHAFAPSLPGLYGLSNATEWIYIGETDNIKAELLTHLGNADSHSRKWNPTGFVYEVCANGARRERQNRLVKEYEPTLNR